MMSIFFTIMFIMMMFNYNCMIMFYVNLCFMMVFLLFIYYSIFLGEYWIMISSYFSYDIYSFFMIMLCIWIMGLMLFTLFNMKFMKFKLFIFYMILLILIMFFSSLNLMLMYFFYEISLIPTFFIIIYWGGAIERLEASFYLMIYMMFISLPFLIYIMSMYMTNFSLDLNLLMLNNYKKMVIGYWDYMIIFGSFFIKLPIYLFHIWLPKAHVEAPVYGSMLLAAILLKLGGYGLLRLLMMFKKESLEYNKIFMSLSIIGSLYLSILCLMQIDMKMLVAYSSVVHMNLMLCSLFSLMKLSFISSLIIMISHGLCSSGLFYMVNIFYSRSFSRLIILNKGNLNFMPSVCLMWFLLCSSNFSFPFSINFLGEIMIMMILLSWSILIIYFLMMISFFSGAYSLYLFSIIIHGKINLINLNIFSGLFIEYLISFLHYLPLLLMMFNMYMFIF